LHVRRQLCSPICLQRGAKCSDVAAACGRKMPRPGITRILDGCCD